MTSAPTRPRGTDLLRIVFDGPFDALREATRDLSAADREALAKECLPGIKRLLQALRFEQDCERESLVWLRWDLLREGSEPGPEEPRTVISAVEEIDENASIFLRYGDADVDSLSAMFIRTRALHTALASPSKLRSTLRESHWSTPIGESWVPYVGRTLLDRDPDVSLPALEQWLLSRETAISSDSRGFRVVFDAVRKEHPDWLEQHRAAATVLLSRVMRGAECTDSGQSLEHAESYDEWMLLLPLTDPDLFSGELSSGPAVESLPFRAQLVSFAKVGHVSRRRLVQLCINKLRAPLRPASTRAWAAFYEELDLNDAERAEHRAALIALASAAPAPGAKIGIAECKLALDADASVASEVLPQLTLALEHPVGVVASNAFNVLKAVARVDALAGAVRAAAVDALSTPHRALRKELEKWLGDQDVEDFSDQERAKLMDAWTDLHPDTQKALSDLEGIPGLEPESPPTDELEARARVVIQREWKAGSIDDRRANAVSTYLETAGGSGAISVNVEWPGHERNHIHWLDLRDVAVFPKGVFADTIAERGAWLHAVRNALRRGVLTESQFADGLNEVILGGSRNKHIDDMLGELVVGSRTGAETVLLAMERLLRHFEELAPRTGTLVLERILDIAETWSTHMAPESIDLVAAISQRRNAAGMVARALLARVETGAVHPRELRLAVAHLEEAAIDGDADPRG